MNETKIVKTSCMRTKPTKMDRSYLRLSFLQLQHIQNPTLNHPKSRMKCVMSFAFSLFLHAESRRGGQSVLAHGAYAYYIKEEHPCSVGTTIPAREIRRPPRVGISPVCNSEPVKLAHRIGFPLNHENQHH